MITQVFKYYTTAIIGLIESEREINFDRTNVNDVKFETVIGYKGGFSLHYSISYGGIELMKNFYGVTDPEKVTLQGIIDAVKDMADFLEENKYMDQFELQTLIQERYEDS
jgi:hypothetical protein